MPVFKPRKKSIKISSSNDRTLDADPVIESEPTLKPRLSSIHYLKEEMKDAITNSKMRKSGHNSSHNASSS